LEFYLKLCKSYGVLGDTIFDINIFLF